ncbi:MAG: DEAD/DEAH box helicase [Planctomycetota bacterium]
MKTLDPAPPGAPVVADASAFAPLALHPTLVRTLAEEGYKTPTPIQAKAIPPAREGHDLLGIAQTGTGKTAAFALPILHRLVANAMPNARPPKGRRPRVLVLSPTRELAAQIGESFATYGRGLPVRGTVIFGGVGQNPQVAAIKRGLDVLVATPGRLIDLLGQGLVDLGGVDTFVLDEADRMLDMGFIEPIRRIAGALPRRRQTLLFSATMPTEIESLAAQLLHDPVRVEVTPVATTVDRIAQRVYGVTKRHKTTLLLQLFEQEPVDLALVFTRTKHGADKVVRHLRAAGVSAGAIHGNRSQNQRTQALDAFKSGRSPVLVATDIAARGLDVDGVTHVFNYDLPMEPEAYVHRIGRTARAGASGVAISFCDAEERGLLKAIERLARLSIPRAELPAAMPEDARPAERAADAPSPTRGGGRGGARGRGGHGSGGGHPKRGRRSGGPGGAGGRARGGGAGRSAAATSSADGRRDGMGRAGRSRKNTRGGGKAFAGRR